MELTKWPRLLVVGDKVTEDQAAEIIVRTTDWWLSANDREWVRRVAEAAGLAFDDGWVNYEAAERFTAEVGGLSLEYLKNSQIVSAWIGGPHGWVEWSGRVGCSTWNIGKWPESAEVIDDLVKIATAWPFLRMDVQLVADEGEGPLVAYWHVEAGAVDALVVDGADLIRPVDEVSTSQIMSRLTSPLGERGSCSLDQLRRGVELARAAAAS